MVELQLQHLNNCKLLQIADDCQSMGRHIAHQSISSKRSAFTSGEFAKQKSGAHSTILFKPDMRRPRNTALADRRKGIRSRRVDQAPQAPDGGKAVFAWQARVEPGRNGGHSPRLMIFAKCIPGSLGLTGSRFTPISTSASLVTECRERAAHSAVALETSVKRRRF